MSFSAKFRFTSIMVITASISMLLVGAIAWFEGQKSLENAEFTHLTGIRTAKARQIEDYFKTINDQLVILSEDQTIILAMVQLSRGFRLLAQNAVPKAYEDSLETFYKDKFIPKLKENLAKGEPEYRVFRPTTQPGRYLQYHYIAQKPTDADAIAQSSSSQTGDDSEYGKFHQKYHLGLRKFQQRFGFYDTFLIDFDTGNIVYSVAKEVDYGTNLLIGPYRTTGLAEVVRKIQGNPQRGKVQIIDFAPYIPSYNMPSSFIAAPIYHGEHIIGIIALQVPTKRIQDIMTSQRSWQKDGMGESGETYLVGSDLLMRSDSRFLLEGKKDYFNLIRNMGMKEEIITLMDKLNTTILLQPVDTESARATLRGEEGDIIAKDYRGISVLSSYSKLNIEGLDWGIISEINKDESFQPIVRLLKYILLSTAIFIPIVAYLSFLLSQGFLRPVRTLVTTAKDIRHKYDADDHDAADRITFKTRGASEYQELSKEMNHIMKKVRKDNMETRQKKREYTDLITNTLPLSVAERFKNGEELITDSAKQATATFIQLENFSSVFNSDDMRNTMFLLEGITSKIHKAAEQHGIDLFNQIGMEFRGVCGLTLPYLNHFERSMKFLHSILDITAEFNSLYDADLVINIGVDVGPMFGALQTTRVIEYDILSDTVYTAQEVGYSGSAGKVTISSMAKDYCTGIDLIFAWEKTDTTIRVNDENILIWTLSKTNLAKQLYS